MDIIIGEDEQQWLDEVLSGAPSAALQHGDSCQELNKQVMIWERPRGVTLLVSCCWSVRICFTPFHTRHGGRMS